jgi:hypothetical protein
MLFWIKTAFFCIGIIFLVSLLGRSYCVGNIIAKSTFGETPVIESDAVDESYTLFSPLSLKPFSSAPGNIYLTDVYGKPVHIWETQYPPMFSILKKDAHLVVELVRPADIFSNPGGGGTGILQELDWNGNILWQYENPLLHHDFDVLPDGRIIALVWEKVPEDIARRIPGGRAEREGDPVWGMPSSSWMRTETRYGDGAHTSILILLPMSWDRSRRETNGRMPIRFGTMIPIHFRESRFIS